MVVREYLTNKKFDWGKLVLICTALLFIIALFKFLFWTSIVVVVIGFCWIVLNINTQNHENSWIAVALIVGGLLLAMISYQIGYAFEKSTIGKPIVDTAKTVIDTNDAITQIELNATKEALGAVGVK